MKKNFYILIILIIAACTGSTHTSSKVTNDNYKKDGSTIHPVFTIFHLNDSLSEIHFRISSKDLLYMRNDGINFATNVLISYNLLPTYDSKEISDSSSVRLVDVNNDAAEKLLIGRIPVKARSPRSYYVRIKISDLNRGLDVVTTIPLEKDNDLGRQNFFVKKKESETPLFSPAVHTGEALNIRYKSKLNVNIFVRYYNRDFGLAPPPFSTSEPKAFQYRADSTFMIQMADGVFDFTATKKGFYHFQLDTSKREGLTLFNFGESFPDVRKAEDMIPPLRYITSREEYDDLMASTTKKAAVEKFWLNCTGNTERAREVIKKYYNRVQDANRYFSSYLEGWKSDRGMVYLIYGAPNVIYRSANSETWVYGEENNLNSIQYLFSKVNNPFSDNDYMLDRSPMYKQSWYVAVDIWRQGRTYLQD